MSKEVVAKTVGMPRDEWLRLRQKGIGGSDAAKIMGQDIYCSPYTLYQQKVGDIGDSVAEEEQKSAKNGDTGVQPAYFGTKLESFVADEFAFRTGLNVEISGEMYRSTEYPFMLADVDRVIVGENMGLECKTCNFNSSHLWESDNVPNNYYCQCQHYISVMGWDGMYIACLIGGQRLVYRYIPRSDSFIKELINAERDFWRHVELRIPPVAGIGDEALIKMIPETQYDLIPAIDSDGTMIAELKKAKEDQKVIENKVKLLEVKLKQRIGPHSGIDGLVTWKTTKGRDITDWEAVALELNVEPELVQKHTRFQSGYRVLRLK